jgi:hypothetical protein
LATMRRRSSSGATGISLCSKKVMWNTKLTDGAVRSVHGKLAVPGLAHKPMDPLGNDPWFGTQKLVEPQPTPPRKPRTMADFPFSMQGVTRRRSHPRCTWCVTLLHLAVGTFLRFGNSTINPADSRDLARIRPSNFLVGSSGSRGLMAATSPMVPRAHESGILSLMPPTPAAPLPSPASPVSVSL